MILWYILPAASNNQRRQWHPTPVLLSGKFHGRRSLIGCNPWGRATSHFTFMHWRRKWQPTPVFLPGESQGRAAWWAAVYGVAQSRTWLKRLSSSRSSNTWFCHTVFSFPKAFSCFRFASYWSNQGSNNTCVHCNHNPLSCLVPFSLSHFPALHQSQVN